MYSFLPSCGESVGLRLGSMYSYGYMLCYTQQSIFWNCIFQSLDCKFFASNWYCSRRVDQILVHTCMSYRRTKCESHIEAWWRGDDVGLWCTNQRTHSRSTLYISVLISCWFNQNWVTFLTASLTKCTRYKSHRHKTPRVTITSSHTVCLLGICIRTLTSQPKILQ